MGPRSEDRGYRDHGDREPLAAVVASMGPRSEDRGYHNGTDSTGSWTMALQWVHGQKTVVIHARQPFRRDARQLQWVHGQKTVVIGCSRRPGRRRCPGFN